MLNIVRQNTISHKNIIFNVKNRKLSLLRHRATMYTFRSKSQKICKKKK